MSERKIGNEIDNYRATLTTLRLKYDEHDAAIARAEAERTETTKRLAALIREKGAPEEVKFELAAVDGPRDLTKNREFVTTLEVIDEAARNSAGQLVSWISTERVQTNYPFNPAVEPDYEDRFNLFVGRLPYDARLLVPARCVIQIPVERVSVTALAPYYRHIEPASFEHHLLPHCHVDFEEIPHVTSIDLSSMDLVNSLPLVRFGDEAVKSLFEEKFAGSLSAEQTLDGLFSKMV